MLIDKTAFQVLLGVFMVGLGPICAWAIKIFNLDLKKSLKYFIFLTVLRLATVAVVAIYLNYTGGNVAKFLLVFGTVYSLGLLPEVLLIGRILEKSSG